MNPLKQAIDSGIDANDELASLFARIGTADRPSGAFTVAYRNARRAMATALTEPNPASGAAEIMAELSKTIGDAAERVLKAAQRFGAREAASQLDLYGVQVPDDFSMDLSRQIDSAYDVILDAVDTQANTINALLLNGADDMVLGSGDRMGVLKPSDVLLAGAFWIASLTWGAFDFTVQTYGKGRPFKKQAVAALDERTTDCCLRVHGQIAPLDGKFQLTGTPRFADELDWAPFHWHCRTSCVLYLAEYDDGLTDQLRASANMILTERASGSNRLRHPANAFAA